MDPVTVALEIFGVVAKIAPGILAALFDKESDADAITHCREKLARIKWRPAGSALDEDP